MASWARAAGACAQATRNLLRQEGQLARAAKQGGQQTRGFAAGGHGHHDSVTHEGLTIHKAASWHKYTGQGFAGLMWFWVLYRFYHDFDHFVYGPAAHLEHEIAHEEEHGSHGEEH
ncbi:hypothetical protein CHLNCDRAFT_57885 [Chlorella variabilis]|uniref:Uncharacterized protein n=1 Tax=Chlorella variabilis TaxID=554065 RepID=E1ZEX0_CHLVA|nr:hypothetical protein CHLNCDRAFT_57885 [Chlorella variabilis]EFN55732.1 hypothetical protein CHLNCDRAFT_57885 [Chlorella variabilis]|eukprot:XP_005847834.1 hypothetical protein CHLNCDRAFT_57885 [Chlorella variabilis]